jgi:deoxyribonuclease V
MSLLELHAWTTDPVKAVAIQYELCENLILEWDGRDIHTVAGVDMRVKGDQACTAFVVFTYPELKPIEGVTVESPIPFPYIPGLLTFREGPAVVAAWEKLKNTPDLIMFDGQGIAHPRRFGIAAHMGLWFDRPSIGVAKSRLYGHSIAPDSKRGSVAELKDENNLDQIIGMVLRTRDNVKPVYISPGHLIDVSKSIEFVLNCCTHYRLPETTRWAHQVAAGEKFLVDQSLKKAE